MAQSKSQTIIQVACERRLPVSISLKSFHFTSQFFRQNGPLVFVENTLLAQEDIGRLRNQKVSLHFPFGPALLKGVSQFMGLATIDNLRCLQFAMPKRLVKDEKRRVRRITNFPKDSRLVFSTESMELHKGFLLNISSGGIGCSLRDEGNFDRENLGRDAKVQLDLQLDSGFKISCHAGLCHVTKLPQTSFPSTHHLGFKFLDLGEFAQDRLNQWLFEMGTRQPFEVQPSGSPAKVEAVKKLREKGILIIGPNGEDLDFLTRTLSRKFEVVTCDLNISNIRSAMHARPKLCLVFMNHEKSEQAAFIRKFCSSLLSPTPIIFFGEVSDPSTQQALVGQVKYLGFVDLTYRKPLATFRAVDQLFQELSTRG